MTIYSAVLLLFLILDPVGNIPLFLVALKNVDSRKHFRIIFRELLIGLATLVLFLFLGKYILFLFHVSKSSLNIAGGVVLFLIAIKMIFRGSEEVFSIGVEGEPFIVPLAIPLIAGPSAMTMVIILMASEPERWVEWLIAIVIAWALTSIILIFSKGLRKLLKRRGITALERLTGMLLVTISVEMLVAGIKQSFFQ
jgi:multiple antibiotic resistance protein